MPTNTRRKKVAKKATKRNAKVVASNVTLTLKQAQNIQSKLAKAGVTVKAFDSKISTLLAL